MIDGGRGAIPPPSKSSRTHRALPRPHSSLILIDETQSWAESE